jgi:acetyl esterase
MLDPTSPGASHVENAEGYFHTEAAARWYWAQYLGARDLADDPNVNPIRAPDVAGVAPATVVVAELDPGRDDGEEYAAALEKAGVPVDLRGAEGMFHGFFGVASFLPPAAAIRDAVYESVGAALRA